MIDESLIKRHSIGRDGFTWWLGQVCEAKTWEANYPELDVETYDELPGFKRRVKVSILGWHTSSKEELKNDELPWAYCLMPTSAGGGSGGFSESLALTGGEWVFGFFLDGNEGQQPVIIGLFDKSTQEDFRKDIPDIRYEPFSGFTNDKPEPLSVVKPLDAIKKSSVGNADLNVGKGGIKQQKQKTDEPSRTERSNTVEIKAQLTKFQHENLKATGDMQVADNSPAHDPLDNIKVATQRLAKELAISKDYQDLTIGNNLKIWNSKTDSEAQKRAASIVAAAQRDLLVRQSGATLEKMGEAFSNIATLAPLSKMLSAKFAGEKSTEKLIGTISEMIGKLPLDAMDFVKSSSGRLVSQPPCVVEGYTGSLMGKTLGNIDGKMTSMMGDINNVIASVDKVGSFAKMGLGAASALTKPGGLSSMLTKGLSSLGGVSVSLDGIAKFKSSIKKIYPGELPLPSPKGGTLLSALSGGLPLPPAMEKMGNVLEGYAAKATGIAQLATGITNFTGHNSIFNTAINLDNTGIGDLGGLGGITDALGKAQNLSDYQDFPGSTGQSILQSTKTLLAGGGSFDAALIAAETLFPGGRNFIKKAFENQIKGQRFSGSECETGPMLNGPPLIEIWGGGGTGATANAVVGPKGNILAIDVTRPGKGYSEPPFCAVIDRSGMGKGAVIRAEIDEDEVKKNGSSGVTAIIVVDPGFGYLPSPDGSVGGNGMKFADADNTCIKDKEGRWLSFKPNIGIDIPPGGTVYLPAGSKAQLPTSAVTTSGESIVAASGSNIVNYAALQLMQDFDVSAGNIIPGNQGAEGAGKPGFGKGVDYKRAKEEGYSDADIRYFLEGDPARGQQSYFVNRMNGAIGRNMQKLLDDPKWGMLPVMNSAGKKPGKIKSLQINLKKGYKGYAKVTDGSRNGAGPITGLRDAVTDRKISNVLERQTGDFLNINQDLPGNEEILELFKQAELRSIEGTPVEGYGKFGESGFRSWEQTRQEVGSKYQSHHTGGGMAKDVYGNDYRTLDPWRADLPDGTRLKFRGLYNHNSPMTVEQKASPYDVTKNNYRYFVFDYEVEVYSTPLGYDYVFPGSVDTVKTKWYKLIGLELVAGTDDFFNGETVVKRCKDKAGRLYELNIQVCTYDDDTAEAIGQGLATNSEGYEIVRTPVLCQAPIQSDKHADYQPVRWYRKNIKGGIPDDNGDLYGENWGHIPGTERNTLVREIIKIYNSFGDKKYGYAYNMGGEQGRMYADRPGLDNWIQDYFKWLKELTKGETCETETYTVGGVVEGYNGPGVYLDLRGTSGSQTVTFREAIDDSGIHHSLTIPGAGEISEIGLNWGSTAKTVTLKGGRIYGPITSPTAAGVWVGNENPPHIAKNDLPENLRTNKLVMLEEMSDDFDDFGVSTTVGKFARITKPPSTPPVTKTRKKKVQPLTMEEYNSYRNNLNQKPEPRAFACVQKFMLAAAKEHFDNEGPVWKELTYCDWAREYVDEVQKVFRPTTTIGYELPCGGKITTPEVTAKPPEVPTYPTILEIDEVIPNSCGDGYNDGDGVTFNGIPGELILAGNSVVGARPPKLPPLLDYPEVTINSDTGVGADLECTLKTVPVTPDMELLPAEIVEVIDCVGKNIFINES